MVDKNKMYVEIPRIKQVKFKIIHGERDENTVGQFAFAPELVQEYLNNEFHKKPKSREEMIARGLSGGWNGEVVTVPLIEPRGNDLTISLMRSRYLWTQAMAKCTTKNPDLTSEQINFLSPRLGGVAVVAIYRTNEGDYFLSQIKGKGILGDGEAHGAFAAGGLEVEELYTNNPLMNASMREMEEETGLSLAFSPVLFMMNEAVQGMVNFGTAAAINDLEQTLNKFYKTAQGQPLKKVEAGGFALVPVDAEITTTEKGDPCLENVLCFVPKVDGQQIVTGLEEVKQDRILRGYGVGLLKYIKDQSNLKYLLDKAGF